MDGNGSAPRLRLRGVVGYVVPSSVDRLGKRRGNFGFVRCDGVVEGELDPRAPSPIGVDHFFHVRDVPGYTRVEDLQTKRIAFTPAEHPKGPRAIEAEVIG